MVKYSSFRFKPKKKLNVIIPKKQDSMKIAFSSPFRVTDSDKKKTKSKASSRGMVDF